MHLTLHIQACCVISPIMEIDKRELSYHNPTYITVGNCYFRRLKAKRDGRNREGRKRGSPPGWRSDVIGAVLMEQLLEMQAASDCRPSSPWTNSRRQSQGCSGQTAADSAKSKP